MIAVDQPASDSRRRALIEYLRANVDDGAALTCAAAARCRSSVRASERFVEGQLSHVGPSYELVVEGRSMRILVVSKQVGGSLDNGGDRGHEHVSVDDRTAQVDSAKWGPNRHPRTNHMVGTELALKVLINGDADGPREVRTANGDVHVFDCFALANATLCSAAKIDSSGEGSSTMFSNCQRHLQETIRILEPTVVIAQGWSAAAARVNGPSTAWAVSTAFGRRTPVTDPTLAVCRQPWGDVAVITAYHPARHWFSTSAPYWQRIAPLLLQARNMATRLPPGQSA
ncbi:MAG TPA: hypothetical protein DCQ04_14020 [Actinobacteria bacterium]|nr:hypothetical protein [Actinomycetota bacterium]